MKSAKEWCASLSNECPQASEIIEIQRDAMADLANLLVTMQTGREFPFYFPDGRNGKLVIPKFMVMADVELLKSQFAHALATIEATTPWEVLAEVLTPGSDAPEPAGG